MTDIGRSLKEEDCTKCFLCSMGLSPIESMLYGNRCLWCGEEISIPSLITFLFRMYYDYRIYKVCLQIKNICKDPMQARTLYLGSMGVYGFNNFVKLKTVKDRKNLLSELKYVLKKINREGVPTLG